MTRVAPRRTLRAISVCAGIAGLDLALRLAGIRSRTVLYIEREAPVAAVLAARMADGFLDPAPVWSDLGSFDAGPWSGAVDLVMGGIPCTPFSQAGKRSGVDDERWLWPDVRQILDVTQASILIIENVPGLARAVSGSSDGDVDGESDELARTGLALMCGDLAARGFDAEWIGLRASDVGAPHERKRIFLLAWRAVANNNNNGLAQLRAAFDDDGRHASGHDVDRCGASLGAQARGLLPSLPGPDDADGWAAYLRDEPRAVPAIPRSIAGLRGDSHGLPDWLVLAQADRPARLRHLGNAVCPRQAAVALRLLIERACVG